MEAIKLSTVLAQLDEKVLPDGSQKTFSIKFIKKNGELVYYPRCVSCGLNMNLKANAMRGVRLVDRNFDPLDHHTPVYIWSILEFNGNPVILK
ncbi:MAG: hypothetical protein HQ565_10080 [Bacteroidetes bacterium]|nr:hypothetical protein [Bacteroidota bacterium]